MEDDSYYLEIPFLINNEPITIKLPQSSDSELLFKLTNDDIFTSNYIKELINTGFISLRQELKTIHRRDNEEKMLIYPERNTDSETDILIENDSLDMDEPLEDITSNEASSIKNDVVEGNKLKQSCEWTDEESKMLLEHYEQFISKVGPMKKFKNKKIMWQKIADIINEYFHTSKTGLQVENRYKTIMKRKKTAIDNNSRSGATRMNIPYEEEVAKITALDDSIEPEVLASSSKGIIILKRKAEHVENLSSTSKQKTVSEQSDEQRQVRKQKTVQEVLIELHTNKEEAKERRHKEKLDLIREIFNRKE